MKWIDDNISTILGGIIIGSLTYMGSIMTISQNSTISTIDQIISIFNGGINIGIYLITRHFIMKD